MYELDDTYLQALAEAMEEHARNLRARRIFDALVATDPALQLEAEESAECPGGAYTEASKERLEWVLDRMWTKTQPKLRQRAERMAEILV